MASTKQKNDEPKKGLVFNVKDFLPQGMNEADLVKVGGLRPIAAPDVMQEAPVAGWLIAELDMPPRLSIDPEKRKRGEKEPWSALLIELTHATKAYVGEEIVDVDAGREVIIPVNGALRNNRDVLLAASEPERIFWALFMIDPDQPQISFGDARNDMWNYLVKLNANEKAAKPRGHKYSLKAFEKMAPPVLPPSNPATAAGQPVPAGQPVNAQGQPVSAVG